MRTAYLDIDGTLVEGGLWSVLINQLITEGRGEQDALRSCLEDLETPGISGMGAIRHYIPEALRTVTPEALATVADRAWRNVELMPPTVHLARLLYERGVRVVLVSGAPQVLADRVGGLFAADAVHACRILSGDPDFTQFIGSPEKKARIVQEDGADLSRSLAIGNGFNDIGMLTAVGIPIAFEPSARLARVASAEGWRTANRYGLMTCVDSVL